MEDILNKLAEWKEKILFGVIVLATLMIVSKADVFGEDIADIDAEARTAAITAAGIDQAMANKVLAKLENPSEYTPSKPDESEISRPFFDDAQVEFYQQPGASGWTLTQESYESLPPLQLTTPGFNSLPDFETAAGPRPDLSLINGFILRDSRPVNLTEDE